MRTLRYAIICMVLIMYSNNVSVDINRNDNTLYPVKINFECL